MKAVASCQGATGKNEAQKASEAPRFPEDFRQMLQDAAYPPFEGLAEELEHGTPLCSLRLNRAKINNIVSSGKNIYPEAPSVNQAFGESSQTEYSVVPWWPEGIYLPYRPKFTLHPAIHQGLFYVQDASSMAVGAVVKHLRDTHFSDRNSLNVLDACAAPGGKTGVIADALRPSDALIANEYDFRRAEILSENVAKWGDMKVSVTRGDTAKFSPLKDCFDIIAIDAPCSGEGMMRKDEVAVSQWSPRLVCECAARQKTIVDNLWPALRPGGALIYSTCTFNTSEDEDIVEYITSELGGRAIAVPQLEAVSEIFHQVKGDSRCYRFIPGKTRGEGLFLCVIIKDGELPEDNLQISEVPRKGGKKAKFSKDKKNASPTVSPLTSKEEATVLEALRDSLPQNVMFLKDAEGSVYALTPALCRLVTEIVSQGSSDSKGKTTSNFRGASGTASRGVDFLSPGTLALRLNGNEYFPAQPLALACGFDASKFPALSLDYAGAMAYLRGEAPVLPDTMPRGPLLAVYESHPLGWLKSLGNRANNLYPKPWRVLSKETSEDFLVFNFLNNY